MKLGTALVIAIVVGAAVGLPLLAADELESDSDYQAGITLRDQDRLDESIAKFDQVLSKGLNRAGVFYARGTAWRWKGETAKALEDFKQAASLDPENALYQKEVDGTEFDLGQRLMLEAARLRSINDYGGALLKYHAALKAVRNDRYREQLKALYNFVLSMDSTLPQKQLPPGDYIQSRPYCAAPAGVEPNFLQSGPNSTSKPEPN